MYLEDQRDAVLSSLYLFYCQVTLHVSGVSRTHHQEYTNCSYKHWYKSCCKLQRYHLDENCGLESWFKLLTCNFCACNSGFFWGGMHWIKLVKKYLQFEDKIQLKNTFWLILFNVFSPPKNPEIHTQKLQINNLNQLSGPQFSSKW